MKSVKISISEVFLSKRFLINENNERNKILRITQIKSGIGYKPKAKATLRALGCVRCIKRLSR